MKILILYFFVFSSYILFGQKNYEVNSLTSIKYFLAGDIQRADKYISESILLDSNRLDYFYLRAVYKLYLNDTASAIIDFIKAVELKNGKIHQSKDSIVHLFVVKKPLCSSGRVDKEFQLTSELCEIQLGVWLFLYGKNKKMSCTTLKNIRDLKNLSEKICK